MASGNAQQIAEYQDFLQSNAEALGSQMTHLLKGLNIAATSKPEAIVGMRQEEIESILGSLSSRMEVGARPGATADQIRVAGEASGQLATFIQNYTVAVKDPRLSVRLDQGGARAMKAFAEDSPWLDRINHTEPDNQARADRHLDLIDGSQQAIVAAADPAAATAMTDLSAHINPNGTIT